MAPPPILVGRNNILGEFEENLSQFTSEMAPTPEHYTVCGEYGVGKTSLLYKFGQIAYKNNFLPVLVNQLEGSDPSTNKILDHIIGSFNEKSLRDGIAATRAIKNKGDITPNIQESIDSIKNLEAGKKYRELCESYSIGNSFSMVFKDIWDSVRGNAGGIYLILDEADYLIDAGMPLWIRNMFFGLNMADYKYMLGVSVRLDKAKTRERFKDREVTAAFGRHFPIKTLPRFNSENTRTFFYEYLKNAPLTISPHLISKIYELTGGHPYVLQVTGWHAYDHAYENDLNKMDENEFSGVYPKILGELGDNFFNYYYTGFEDNENKREIVLKICENGGAMSYRELKSEMGIPEKTISSYLSMLIENGVLRRVGHGKYTVFLNAFSDYYAKKWGGEIKSKRNKKRVGSLEKPLDRAGEGVEPVKVFISSRIDELKGERDAVEEAIDELREENLPFEAWRWEKEEETIPSGKTADEIQSEELKDSDVYLLIFGSTYGAESGISPTHKEFEEAKLEFDKDCILVYVKNVERVDERQKRWLEDIEKQCTYKAFKDVDELNDFVKNRLRYLWKDKFDINQ